MGGGLSPLVPQDIVLVPMPGPSCGGLLSLRIYMHACNACSHVLTRYRYLKVERLHQWVWPAIIEQLRMTSHSSLKIHWLLLFLHGKRSEHLLMHFAMQ